MLQHIAGSGSSVARSVSDMLKHNLPCCGAICNADGSVCWRVWAPRASQVQLIRIDSSGDRTAVTMRPEPGGHFAHAAEGVREGERYAYRLDDGPERPDPASRWQPAGVHGPSAVFGPDHCTWDEDDWAGARREDLVIYELHVGTFTPEGTFDAVIPRLERLRELGVTAIELMPVAQFPGDRNWGYDGVYLFAVQDTYGGPHGLQRLVNACHRSGIAVILDVVYNHLGPEGNYLAEFGPYFSDRYRTPWGKAMNFDGPDSDAVRGFVLDNVCQWVRDFRIDGLRLDAVHAIFDQSPRHILREIKQVADEAARPLGRPIHVIAESNLNDVRLLDAEDQGGYALDAQWSDDFHYAVHALLTGERHGHYADFGRTEHLVKALNHTFVLDGCYSIYRDRRHGAPVGDHPGDRFVVSIQNHDQVGNRAMADQYDTVLTPAQQRLAAGLLLAPHVPLLFMGQEYGETQPFPFFCSFSDPQLVEAVRRGRRRDLAAFNWQGDVPDPQAESTFHSAKLTWAWPDGTWHAGLRRLYADLLAARRRWPALGDLRDRTTELLSGTGDPGVVRLVRGGYSEPPEVLLAFFNLGSSGQPLNDALPGTAMLLSSEDSVYGGCRTAEAHGSVLAPFEFRLYKWSRPESLAT